MTSYTKRVMSLLVYITMVGLSMGEKSYYEILGVPKQASTSQIKSAYRRLSKQYHPDVSSEPDAKQRFQEIAEGREG